MGRGVLWCYLLPASIRPMPLGYPKPKHLLGIHIASGRWSSSNHSTEAWVETIVSTVETWDGWCGNAWQAAIAKFEEISDVQLQPGIVTSFGCISDVSEGPASRYLCIAYSWINRHFLASHTNSIQFIAFEHFWWNEVGLVPSLDSLPCSQTLDDGPDIQLFGNWTRTQPWTVDTFWLTDQRHFCSIERLLRDSTNCCPWEDVSSIHQSALCTFFGAGTTPFSALWTRLWERNHRLAQCTHAWDTKSRGEFADLRRTPFAHWMFWAFYSQRTAQASQASKALELLSSLDAWHECRALSGYGQACGFVSLVNRDFAKLQKFVGYLVCE